MKITRIDIEGRRGRFATITRRAGCEYIEVTILTPYQPNGEKHLVHARADDEELWEQAKNLQTILDGCLGTGSDIDSYYRELQRLAD